MTLHIKKVFFTYALVAFSIYLSLSWIPDSGSQIVKLFGFAITSFLLIIYPLDRKNHAFDFSLLWLLLLIILLLISFFYHKRISDINFLIKIVLVFILILKVDIKKFLDCCVIISGVIFWPTILGWICGLLGICFEIPKFLMEDGRLYYLTPFLTAQREIVSYRAYSYFWEPGVFSYFISIVIFYRLFVLNEKINRLKKEFIYILISQSVGGLVICAFLILINIIKRNVILDKFIAIVGGAIIILLVSYYRVVTGFMIEALNFVTIPLFERDMTTDISFLARIVDLSAPFIASYEHAPIFGNTDIFNYMSYSIDIRGFSANIITNSWGGLAYSYGFPFMFVYGLISYLGLVKISKSYSVGFWYLLLLCANPVYSTLFNCYFIFGCLKYNMND